MAVEVRGRDSRSRILAVSGQGESARGAHHIERSPATAREANRPAKGDVNVRHGDEPPLPKLGSAGSTSGLVVTSASQAARRSHGGRWQDPKGPAGVPSSQNTQAGNGATAILPCAIPPIQTDCEETCDE